MNLAYAIALVSSVCFGTADLFGGLAARRGPAANVALFSAFPAIGILLVAMIFIRGTPAPTDLRWAVAAGLASTAGTALIFRALAMGPMSVASPVLCVVGLSLPVVAGVAIGERPSGLAWLGVALAVAAIPALSIPAGHEDAPSPAQVRKTVLVSIAAGLAAGCFLISVARIGSAAGMVPLIVARLVAIAVFVTAFLVLRRPVLPPAPARPMAAAAGALDSTANVAYWVATHSAPMSLVAPLVSRAPAPTRVEARAFLGERWSGWQKLGLLLALAAGVCISRG